MDTFLSWFLFDGGLVSDVPGEVVAGSGAVVRDLAWEPLGG